MIEKQSIILFDGVCNLYSEWVQFVAKKEPNNRFKFTSLQADYTAKSFTQLDSNYEADKPDSIVLIVYQQLYFKWSAVLMICSKLKMLWPALFIFTLIPKVIRGFIYDLIAEGWCKLFRKKEVCEMSKKIDSSVFIE